MSRRSIGNRVSLDPRRRSETRRIEWVSPLNRDGWTQKIYVTIGYDEDALTPREIFYDEGYKSGSDMETLLRDLCIVLSVFLQYDGIDINDFMGSISRELNHRTDQLDMGSIVGVLMHELKQSPHWAVELQATKGQIGEAGPL
ncbi:hypothetical protein WG622_17300 [Cognatishimia sp. D5M38]|uniref:Uncharacterized protein n=1 Tax=Cognatishimia coralii TaxID=3083254 RepID=A0ABU8QKR7_9RHOB|nr:hypothetical protein [Donghicola eburneus]MCI5040949.1 hypothetical protein [Donghicola eburneus]